MQEKIQKKLEKNGIKKKYCSSELVKQKSKKVKKSLIKLEKQKTAKTIKIQKIAEQNGQKR